MKGIAVMYHPPNLWPFSGSERRFVSLSKILLQKFHVEFYTIETTPTIGNYMQTFYRSFPVYLSTGNLFFGLLDWLFQGLKAATSLSRKTKFDFVYATNNNLYNLLLGYLIGKVTHLPLIVVVHHFRWTDYVTHGTSSQNFTFNQTFRLMKRNGLNARDAFLRTLGANFENMVLKRADIFVTISHTIASQMHSLGIKNPIFVSGNGIDIEFLNSISRNQVCDDNAYDCIYVGRLDEGKGVLDLLQVWKTIVSKLEKAKIAIVGNGKLRNRAEVYVKNNKLTDNVKFLGYVNDVDLIRTIWRSRLFVTLSTTEGWGLAIAEALACGLPVVAYAIPTLCETFGECSTVKFAKVGANEQVAEAIVDYLTNLDDYNKKEIAGISKDFATKLDWETVARKEFEAIRKSGDFFGWTKNE